MAMTCAEFLWRLDSSETLDAGARAHASTCASCKTALARWEAAAGALRAWAKEPPPPFLHGRLMAHLREARAEAVTGRAWWRRPAWIGSAAAVVFVAGLSGLMLRRAPWLARAPQEAPAKTVATEAAQEARPEPLPAGREAHEVRRADEKADLRARGNEAWAPAREAVPTLDRPAPGRAREQTAGEAERKARPGPADEREQAEDELERERPAAAGALRAAPAFAPAPPPRGAPASSRSAVGEEQRAPEGPQEALAKGSSDAHRQADEEDRLRSLGYLEGAARPEQPSTATPARAKRALKQAGIACRVVPEGGGAARIVTLSAQALPEGDQALIVVVDAEGGLRVVAAPPPAARGGTRAEEVASGLASTKAGRLSGETPAVFSRADLDALHAMALAPGRYRIERAE